MNLQDALAVAIEELTVAQLQIEDRLARLGEDASLTRARYFRNMDALFTLQWHFEVNSRSSQTSTSTVLEPTLGTLPK